MFFSYTYITDNGSTPLYSNLKVIAVPVLANLAYGSFKNTFIKKKILF